MGIQSLIPVKNIEYAVNSFVEFLKWGNIDNAIIVLVGDGPMRDSLEQLSASFDLREKIVFTGGIANSEIVNYLSLANVVIATSLYSNMNRSVQEAMACGKPVIAFNSGGTGRTIIDGQTGLLVKSGDVKEFSAALMKLYRDPELGKLLGENARKFIMNSRSWKSRIDLELAVYDKLMTNKNSTT
jgi:glycosyltransferase involved in cell wall biosynthesis